MIDYLSKYLAEDLARVEDHWGPVMESDTALVRETCQYVRSTQGKKLRPMLTLLSCRAFRYTGVDHSKLAAALELIHTAALLHDDVIDKAPLRRGRETISARWGDDVAILTSDYLYSHAFKLAMQTLTPKVLSVICQVTAAMCEGELFQIEKRDCILTRDDYLRIVRSKTAYLFSACTGLGSMLAQAGEMDTARLTTYGLNFGIAFQITDDTLDLVADDAETGKQHGTDIRNGKQTLPLIHTLEVASADDRNDLLNCWNNGRDRERILGHIRKYRGIEYALGEAKKFAESANEQLTSLEPSEPVDLLRQLSDYVVDRRS